MTITSFQHREMMRRLDANRKRDPEPVGPMDACENESELHEQIRVEIARRGWIGFHGSMAHRTHRTIGEPDWIVVAHDGRVIFMEAKRKGAKLTTEQSAIIVWLLKLKATAVVVYSMKDVLKVFDKPAPLRDTI